MKYYTNHPWFKMCIPEYMWVAFKTYEFDVVVDAAFRFARLKLENEIYKMGSSIK